MTDDLLPSEDKPLFDSGYTDEELDAIWESLTTGADLDSFEHFSFALSVGISDGDLVPLSERGTVMLSTPREAIDARVAAIREAMAAGATFTEALERTADGTEGDA